MKKIILSLFTFILMFSFMSQAQAAGFSDVTQYKDEIKLLSDKKVISGYPDGTFKPGNDLTRLQAVTMILREKGITDYTAPNPNFTDVKPGNYGYEIIAKAVDLGFISGKTNKDGRKYFDPSAPLTRGQMAKILVEGYKLPKTKESYFSDVPKDNGFKDYISVLATENITTGYPGGTFRPNQKLSRQHFAVFMARMLDEKFKLAPKRKVYLDPVTKRIMLNNITTFMSKGEVVALLGKPQREYRDPQLNQELVQEYPGMSIYYSGEIVDSIIAEVSEKEFFNEILHDFEGQKFTDREGHYVLYSKEAKVVALYKYENGKTSIYLMWGGDFDVYVENGDYVEIN